MKDGPKPKPTHLKLIMGNPGKRTLNRREPQPIPLMPDPPLELSADALIEWNRLAVEQHRIGLLTMVDRAAMAAYCEAYSCWAQCQRALKTMAAADQLTSGLLIRTTNGNAIQNPLVGTRNKAQKDMVHFAAELGMTPSARSRIEVEGRQIADPTDEFLGA
jgi:P27 family predicted phage terminase small subunit